MISSAELDEMPSRGEPRRVSPDDRQPVVLQETGGDVYGCAPFSDFYDLLDGSGLPYYHALTLDL